jgi:hypothetical protein
MRMHVRVHVKLNLELASKLKQQITEAYNSNQVQSSIHTIIEFWMLTTIIRNTTSSTK